MKDVGHPDVRVIPREHCGEGVGFPQLEQDMQSGVFHEEDRIFGQYFADDGMHSILFTVEMSEFDSDEPLIGMVAGGDFCLETIVHLLTHEYLHHLLYRLEDELVSVTFDNLDPEVFPTYNDDRDMVIA